MLATESFSSLSQSSSDGLLFPNRDTSKNMDAEMILPLTSSDNLSSQTENMPSFQSARDRLDRISHPVSNGGGFNAATATWRRSTGAGEPVMVAEEVDSRQHSLADADGTEDRVNICSVLPGPVWPTDTQLKVASGYAIRRDDGLYTRLIRADELGSLDLSKIPATQAPRGLITLPLTKLGSHEGCDGSETISRDAISSLPLNSSHRPKVPAHAGTIRDPKESFSKIDKVQRQIDSIVQNNLLVSAAAQSPVRRQKIYCDKWIHEGVCAFTQLGCKYKHEMPMDKATQLSLGLNHGLPAWYKRSQAVNIRPKTPCSPTSPQIRMTGAWRRSDDSSGSNTGVSVGSSLSPQSDGYSAFSGKFGPIGPPSLLPSGASLSSNPFSTLSDDEDLKMEQDDDDEEIITWSGRRR